MKLKQNRKVVFDELTHSYWCGDAELVGVTTLMKHQGLSANYEGIDPHVLAHAAARGTAIHRTLEDYDNGDMIIQPITVDDNEGGKLTIDTGDELAAYRALGLKVLASEYLVSDNKTVASSIDKVLETDEDSTVDLGDVKTTSTLHIDALEWQLSIYAYLFELQNKGVKVRNLFGIHVRNGKAAVRQVRRIDTDTIKKLIKCEREGEKFIAGWEGSELSSVIPANEIAELVGCEREIAALEAALKTAQSLIRERRDTIYSYMLANGIGELKCPSGSYKLARPSVRASFDSKRLKEDNPEIYAKYVSHFEVSGRVTFKPNNNNE